MNFQDLFARYREMGAMAPQQSFGEQLFIRGQNVAPSSWSHPHEPPSPSMDLPSPQENSGGAKRERIMFKLPSPNTFRAFLLQVDEEHEQCLSRDEEVEDLLQSPPLQQGWNLGLLKTNSMCKDYYKLTSNVLRTLIMGIKEIADGEISPAWQIAQDRAHQKQSNFSNMFLQNAASNTEAVPYPVCCRVGDDDSIQGKDEGKSEEIKPSVKLAPTGRTPPSKDVAERSRDIISISELRKWLWGQLVPNTCLGTNLDPRQDVEKKMKAVQDSRMKVINAAGFAVSDDNYNSAFPEKCLISVKKPPQQAVQDLQASSVEDNVMAHLKPTRIIECVEAEIDEEERIKDTEEGDHACQPEAQQEDNVMAHLKPTRIIECVEAEIDEEERTKDTEEGDHACQPEAQQEDTKNSWFLEEEEDAPVEKKDLRPAEVEEVQVLRRNQSIAARETMSEVPKLQRSDCPPTKGTRFSIENAQQHNLDGEFGMLIGETERPPGSPTFGAKEFIGVDDGPSQGPVDSELKCIEMKDGEPQCVTKCKETTVPRRSVPKSWCVVGGFTTRSRTIPKGPYTNEKSRRL